MQNEYTEPFGKKLLRISKWRISRISAEDLTKLRALLNTGSYTTAQAPCP